MLKSVNKFIAYVKQDTKTKVNKKDNDNINNNKPDIEKATNDDIKAYIID